MQECRNCRIKIRGNKKCCPLCQGEIYGESENPAFPALNRTEGTLSFIRISSFMLLALEIVLVFLLCQIRPVLRWIPWVMLLSAVIWVNLMLCYYFRANILLLLIMEGIVGSGLVILIDLQTGFHRWSFEYVIPIIWPVVNLFILAASRIMKLLAEEFIAYPMLCAGISLLQLIPIFVNLNRFHWPALISMILMCVMALGVLLFEFQALRESTSRIFHI